jgi:hypothetical protein
LEENKGVGSRLQMASLAERMDAVDRAGILSFRIMKSLQPARQLIVGVRRHWHWTRIMQDQDLKKRRAELEKQRAEIVAKWKQYERQVLDSAENRAGGVVELENIQREERRVSESLKAIARELIELPWMMWNNLSEASDPCACPLEYFLPHLSQRTQRILKQLGVKSVGDLLRLSRAQIFSCEGGGDTVLCELRLTILTPRNLKAQWDYPLTATEQFYAP